MTSAATKPRMAFRSVVLLSFDLLLDFDFATVDNPIWNREDLTHPGGAMGSLGAHLSRNPVQIFLLLTVLFPLD